MIEFAKFKDGANPLLRCRRSPKGTVERAVPIRYFALRTHHPIAAHNDFIMNDAPQIKAGSWE
jgi:hypothetical protein